MGGREESDSGYSMTNSQVGLDSEVIIELSLSIYISYFCSFLDGLGPSDDLYGHAGSVSLFLRMAN